MANQHLNNKTLIERYVLKQLSEDELLEFRGAMMFDSELRQQVVEHKKVFHALQTLSEKTEFIPVASSTASTLSYTRKWLLASSITAILGIIAFFTYKKFYSETTTTIPLIEEPTAQIETIDKELTIIEELEEETIPMPEKNEKPAKTSKPETPKAAPVVAPTPAPVVPSSPPNNVIEIPTNAKVEDEEPEEEMIFAAVNVQNYETNEILEEFVNTATRSKSPDAVIIKVNFENGTTLKLSDENKVQLKFEGVIQDADDADEIGPYTFKIYSNDVSDFIEQRPLYDEVVDLDDLEIKFDKTFELKEGLYYFILQDEDDMRYTGKFFVEK